MLRETVASCSQFSAVKAPVLVLNWALRRRRWRARLAARWPRVGVRAVR